jgi:hypothetical protein
MLMNGDVMVAATTAQTSGLLGALDAPFMTDADRVDAIFLAALTRSPREDERELHLRNLAYAANAAERQQGLSDTLWVLLNSTEFAFNR